MFPFIVKDTDLGPRLFAHQPLLAGMAVCPRVIPQNLNEMQSRENSPGNEDLVQYISINEKAANAGVRNGTVTLFCDVKPGEPILLSEDYCFPV